MTSGYLTLCAAGDVCLCGNVERKINDQGVGFPFLRVKEILQKNHAVFGNLENVFTNQDVGTIGQSHLLRCSPENIRSIAESGFNMVSLANNHILDYGEKGLSDTIAALDFYAIQHVGAGKSCPSSREPAIYQKEGITIGILAYAMKGVQSVREGSAGAAVIEYDDIAEDISKLRGNVNHIVVSLHSGFEFIDYPHPEFRELCHKIAALGVSLIVGHHPHVINGIEKVGGCLIAYSLGNFVFDDQIMDYKTERTRQSILLECQFSKEQLAKYRVLPISINSDLQPEIAQGRVGEEILRRLEKISDELRSDEHSTLYFKQAAEVWPKINVAVNLDIIKKQGLVAFLKRLPRIKRVYVTFTLKYMARKAMKFLRRGV